MPTHSRLNDTRRIKSSGNVFLDLSFEQADAEVMKLRAEVTIRVEQHLKRLAAADRTDSHNIEVSP